MKNYALALSLTCLYSALAVAEEAATDPILQLKHTDAQGAVQSVVDIPLQGELLIESGTGNVIADITDPTACAPQTQTCTGIVDPVTFSVSPQPPVEAGTDLTFSWRSPGAKLCQPAGSLTAWANKGQLEPYDDLATPTQRTVATTGLGQNDPFTASLTCSNGTASEIATLSIQINEPTGTVAAGEPEACLQRRLPSKWTRLTTQSLSCHFVGGWVTETDCTEFGGGVWGDGAAPFGSGSLRASNVGVGRASAYEYMAFRFSTAGLPDNAVGSVMYEQPEPGLTGKSEVLMTISRCQGDFNRTPVTEDDSPADSNCYVRASTYGSTLNWRAQNNLLSPNRCILQPDKIYYLNLMFTNSPPGTAPADLVPILVCGSADEIVIDEEAGETRPPNEQCGVLLEP